MGVIHIEHQQIRIADNAGQDVVQIMGHTAGHQPQGFHFLGTCELLLERLSLLLDFMAFRDVTADPQNSHRPGITAQQESGRHLAPHRRAVLAQQLNLQHHGMVVVVSSFR